jgi:hypothetical protein
MRLESADGPDPSLRRRGWLLLFGTAALAGVAIADGFWTVLPFLAVFALLGWLALKGGSGTLPKPDRRTEERGNLVGTTALLLLGLGAIAAAVIEGVHGLWGWLAVPAAFILIGRSWTAIPTHYRGWRTAGGSEESKRS